MIGCGGTMMMEKYAAADTMWVLIGAFMVFFMQPGFAMVETGFTRAKNAGNIVMKNFMDLCLGGDYCIRCYGRTDEVFCLLYLQYFDQRGYLSGLGALDLGRWLARRHGFS